MTNTFLYILFVCCGMVRSDDGGCGTACNSPCQLLCLKMHNYYRALHNSPPMECDSDLAKSAQDWADKQAKEGKMYHSEWTDQFTESISWKGWGWEGMDKMEGAIPGAVRSWYSEIKNGYDYDSGTGNGVIGHFQAVVWKDETKVGCGLNLKVDDGSYVTAHYAPASHTMADRQKLTKDQVQPRKEPAPECNVRSSERVDCFGEPTEEQKVPYVTPEICVQKGCCYDDMYMDEQDTVFYKPPGRTWCFKKKEGAPDEGPNPQPTQQPSFPSALSPEPASRPTSRSTPVPGGGPRTGDKCFVNSCYKFVETGETWAANQDSCKEKGGDLVSMETENEWKFINDQIQRITLPGQDEWHIGLKNQGTWQWVSGKPLNITKWQTNEPSGDGNVAVMSKDYPPGSQGLFNDLKDLIPRPFICELPTEENPPAPLGTTAVPLGETILPQRSTTVPPGTTTMPQGSTVSPSRAGPPNN